MKNKLTLLLILLAFPWISTASPVTPEDLMTVVKLTNQGTIEQGKWLLYSVETPQKNSDGTYSSKSLTYTRNTETGKDYRLPEDCGAYMWNPTQEKIIAACRGEEQEIWEISKQGQKERRLLKIPYGYFRMSISPNGQYLLFSKRYALYDVNYYSVLQDTYTQGCEYSIASFSQDNLTYSSPRKLDFKSPELLEAVWSQNSELLVPVLVEGYDSYKSRKPVQLIKYNPKTQTSTPFHYPPSILWGIHLSPDGQRAALDLPHYDVAFDDIDRMIKLTHIISPNGNLVLSQYAKRCMGWITPESFLLLWTDRTQQKLGIFNIQRELLEDISLSQHGLGRVKDVKIETPHMITFTASTIDAPEEIYLYNQNDKSLKALTQSQTFKVSPKKVEIFQWKSFDDKLIEGLLIYPDNYSPHQTYPVLVDLHGGPPGVFTKRFEGYWHLFSERGYFVFLPNVRGSGGYGEDFLRSVVRRTGEADIKDILAGLEVLADQDLIDPNRMSIQGHSYGGYLTSQMISLTDRFRSAMNIYGPVFYPASAGLSDFDAVAAAYLGSPQEEWDLWLERSPLMRAIDITTPTSVVHGRFDERVSPVESGMLAYVLGEKKTPLSGFLTTGSTHFEFSENGDYRKVKEMLEFHTKWNPPGDANN